MSESENDRWIIECRELTRRYGAQTAVEALDWRVSQGTVTALLGKNGAGKTTTLRMLVNLLRPTRGEAHVLGKKTTQLDSDDFTRVGYIAESQSLPEWMTLGYLLDYLRPMYPTWDAEFCERLVRLFDLPLKRRIGQFSRGMKMKAAFVASLAYRPELLLLDEPFSGLDSLVREDLMDALLEITEQAQWTIVVSSHDVDEIERLVDHVAILNHGRLLLHEPIEEIQRRFRDVSFRIGEGTALNVQSHWIGFEQEGGRVRFIETAFDDVASADGYRSACPDLADLSVEPMTLKAAYVAMLRARRESAEPNSLAS